MAYDLIRWGTALVIFVLLLIILSRATGKKGKAAVISAFVSIILAAVSLLVPFENYFYSFKTVEKIYSYRHHEPLVTYAQCDEGAVCVAEKNGSNGIFYSFAKDGDGYKLPKFSEKQADIFSSKFGVFAVKDFGTETMILTQLKDSAYDGKPFAECENGYYFYVIIDGDFNRNALTYKNEAVDLV